MLGNIGLPTLILIVIVALLLFGPNKLPELGRAFGKTLREFKNGAKEMMSEEEEAQSQRRKDVSDSAVQRADLRAEAPAAEEKKDSLRLPD